ncbi:pisatin demethylase [Periconia macrospinosa]|uniref:Pisatin demethylase n=1 Tax=Periconia macrospinosa TaxID=97972 RepID=A0A2V1DI92_9PLEO|nr:pisatin demethylase [Periconia macrospinosa]
MAPSAHNISQNNDLNSHGRYYVYSFIALILLLIARSIYQILASPLRNVPGPFLARFTRLWELHAIRKHDNPTLNIALHEKYGPVVRLAPNRYSLNSGEAAKVILGHRNALDKSNYYRAFSQPDATNLFSEPSLKVHATIRRPLAQLYSQTTLLSYEPFVDTCNSILLKRFEEYAENGKILNLREMMQLYAFDVIGEITVGSRFGLMEDAGDKSGTIEGIDQTMAYAAMMGLVPEWHSWVAKMAKRFKLHPGRKILNFVDYHLDNRISGRTKSPEDRSDFLDKLLLMEKEGKATRFHTKDAALSNIVAGSDTTAIALTTAIACLSMNPNILTALRDELDAATVAGNLSEPVTFQQAQKLPYLQAVILEALRIHPAVGAPLTRVVGPQGLQIAGYFFPPGTEIGVNAWVIHYNTSIFGADAHAFRPERWLTENKEERAVLDRNFLSFGSGARTCIGKNISLLEMSKVIPQIVRKYDFEIRPNDKGQRFSWSTRWFSKPAVNVVVKKRSQT